MGADTGWRAGKIFRIASDRKRDDRDEEANSNGEPVSPYKDRGTTRHEPQPLYQPLSPHTSPRYPGGEANYTRAVNWQRLATLHYS